MTDEPHDTTLYVLIPPSPLFAAHWSFFLPDSKGYDAVSKRHEESTTGRRLHISGDRLNGFSLEIIREYDVSKHRRVGSRKFPIGIVPAQYITKSTVKAGEESRERETKDEDEGGGFIDNSPCDHFERVCVKVEAPGPSLNNVSAISSGAAGKKTKAEVRDCQWWARQVVNELVNAGMLSPVQEEDVACKSPNELVAGLPLH